MHPRAEEQRSINPKVNGDKTAVAMLKDTQQLGCVFHRRRAAEVFVDLTEDNESLETNSACEIHKRFQSREHLQTKKSPLLGKNLFCRFMSAWSVRTKIRGYISGRDGERQERCARENAWRLAKGIYSSKKKKEEATFFSFTEVWCMPAPSETKP